MRALLNALGLTLWGSIAITLAVALATFGYRASLSYREWRGTGIFSSPAASPATAPYAVDTPAAVGSPGATAAAAISSAATIRPTTQSSSRQELSRVIGKEMTAAQSELQAGEWQDALNDLNAAEQKQGLTGFDKKTIHSFKAFVLIKLNNLKMALTEYERMLATHAATLQETEDAIRMLFSLNAATGNLRGTIDYGEQMVDEGTATPDNLMVIAQSYYRLKDCKNTIIWADRAITGTREAGEAPKEIPLIFKLQCASDAADIAAIEVVLMDLIKLNGKPAYWSDLLRIERQNERDDHNTLMIYRIMLSTNSMNAGTDYIEMAQLLSDAALPGEAFAVLDKAMSGGLIKNEQRERTARLLDALKIRAEADKEGLSEKETEAATSASGESGAKLGEIYYGFAEDQRAMESINRALQKGQLRHLDEAYVYLGLAWLQLKNPADAKKAFANLKAVPNISPRVLKLWELYSDTLDMGS
jgi:tetratricopeptide (TPR) repeat protein